MESLILLVALASSQWSLVNGTTSPTVVVLSYTCTTQHNGTGQPIAVAPGQYTKWFFQQASGDFNPFAPWPNWLNPLSEESRRGDYAWPSATREMIQPGKTYQYTIKWDYESGSQTWLGQGHGTVTRSRN